MNLKKRRVAVRLGGISFCFMLAVLACYRYYGTPTNFLHYLKGRSYLAFPSELDAVSLEPDEKKEYSLTLRNLTTRPLLVAGARNSCNCLTTSAIPVEIPPFDLRAIKLKILAGSVPGPLNQKVSLFIADSEGTHELVIPITCGVYLPDNF